jgi:hypothetical protein
MMLMPKLKWKRLPDWDGYHYEEAQAPDISGRYLIREYSQGYVVEFHRGRTSRRGHQIGKAVTPGEALALAQAHYCSSSAASARQI